MKEIRSEILISAPIDKVWQVLTDFDNWKDWNPMVINANGSALEGSKLTITMCGKDKKDGPKYQPSVLEVKAPSRFRWRVKMMGGIMLTNDRVFKLKEKEGGTELVNSEFFSGLMLLMAGKKLDKFVPPILEQMNLALKNKLEKLS